MQTKKLKIIPLGGLGEFGMNCLALRWEDDIIVIDAGLMFPESELLGVDIVVPDITYLIENKQHVRAIILTHGHEDHIGGLPWILSELKVPVYATEFTLAYVEGKLEEHELLDEIELIEITPKEKFTIGPFTIEPIRVTHSLVDCVALAIETPVGVVIHTGDFKIDLSPLDDKAFDLHTFAEYGKRGVLALLQDSTNVERTGYTPSERAVIPRLDEIFSRTKKKLFFTCFSSSIYRIRIAMELARAHGRKVAIVGPLDDGEHGDCAGSGLHRYSAGFGDPTGTDARLLARAIDDSDQRHAGRADERTEPRGGGQSQACAD